MAPVIPGPGEVLAGRYRIEAELDRGGMGAVLAAVDLQRGGSVAIKWLLADEPALVARMLREARAAASVEHASIVRILDVVPDRGTVFLVMERLHGEPLSERLARGPMSPAEIARLLLPILDALSVVHAAGIVHRDLKPSNVFLARDPATGVVVPKLLDFGIAKVPRDASTPGSLTQTGEVLGSPLYASPEQLRSSRDVDLRTDVYSVGVLLYQALAGVAPFGADTYAGLVYQIAICGSRPLQLVRPDLTPDVLEVVERAMARDPSARYPSVAALAGALARWLAYTSPPVAVPVASLPPHPSGPGSWPAPTVATGPVTGPLEAGPSLVAARPLRRSRAGLCLAVAAALAGGCVLAAALVAWLGGAAAERVGGLLHGPVKSAACLVDANGDGVLDVAGLAGQLAERDLVLLDGRDGTLLHSASGYDVRDALFCPSREWLAIRHGENELHIVPARSPEHTSRRTFQERLTHGGFGPSCVALEDASGNVWGLHAPDGADAPCPVPQDRALQGVGDQPGTAAASAFSGLSLSASGGELRFEVLQTARGAPLSVVATRAGARVWRTELTLGTIGSMGSVGLAWSPSALVLVAGELDSPSSAQIVGLEPATGNILYDVPLCRRHHFLSSLQWNGRYVIATDAWTGLAAIEPATGAIAWRSGSC